MKKTKQYAILAVALGVCVAGYINIQRVYATCDTCGNSGSNQSGSSVSQNASNSNQGSGTSQPQSQTSSNTQTNNPGVGTSTQDQDRLRDTTQDATGTQDQTQLRTQSQDQVQDPTYCSNDSATCKNVSSNVISALQGISDVATDLLASNATLSSSITEVVQGYTKDATVAADSLSSANKRSRFAVFWIGPNYKQLTTALEANERNRLRIQELEQVQNQVSNSGDAQALQEQIELLQQENTNFYNELNTEADQFSFFGWINKLINWL